MEDRPDLAAHQPSTCTGRAARAPAITFSGFRPAPRRTCVTRLVGVGASPSRRPSRSWSSARSRSRPRTSGFRKAGARVSARPLRRRQPGDRERRSDHHRDPGQHAELAHPGRGLPQGRQLHPLQLQWELLLHDIAARSGTGPGATSSAAMTRTPAEQPTPLSERYPCRGLLGRGGRSERLRCQPCRGCTDLLILSVTSALFGTMRRCGRKPDPR